MLFDIADDFLLTPFRISLAYLPLHESTIDIKEGPEGLSRINFKIWTQYNQKSGPKGFMLISVL
jgi:hypothetical protein